MSQNTESNVGFLDLVRFIGRRKWLFFSIWGGVIASAIALAFIASPVYRAEVVLVPSEDDSNGSSLGLGGQLGSLAGLAGIRVGGSDRVQEYVAILEAYGFLSDFIEANELLFALFSEYWDPGTQQWIGYRDGEEPTLWDAVKRFRDNHYDVTLDGVTGLVVLAVEWRDPVTAAEWANQLVISMNELVRRRTIEEAERSIRYLENELDKTSIVGVQQGIYRLIEEQISKIMVANTREEYAFRIVDRAVPASQQDYVRPQRFLIIVIGGIFGFVCATVVVLIWSALQKPTDVQASGSRDAF